MSEERVTIKQAADLSQDSEPKAPSKPKMEDVECASVEERYWTVKAFRDNILYINTICIVTSCQVNLKLNTI